jgi:acyl dehydratase
MKTFDDIDDLRSAVGTHVGYSDWLEVDQRRIDTFAEATGDHQWIHVDPERAAQGPFGTTIAHGFLSLSLIPGLSWRVFSVGGLQMEINYGLNKVRFPTPVPVNSRVRCGIEVLSLDTFGDGFQLVTRVTVELEGSDKPACVAETLGYLVPA